MERTAAGGAFVTLVVLVCLSVSTARANDALARLSSRWSGDPKAAPAVVLFDMLEGRQSARPDEVDAAIRAVTDRLPSPYRRDLVDGLLAYLIDEDRATAVVVGSVPPVEVAAIAAAAVIEAETRFLAPPSGAPTADDMRRVRGQADELARTIEAGIGGRPFKNAVRVFVERHLGVARRVLDGLAPAPLPTPMATRLPTEPSRVPDDLDELDDHPEPPAPPRDIGSRTVIVLPLVVLGLGLLGWAYVRGRRPSVASDAPAVAETPLVRADRLLGLKRYEQAVDVYQNVLASPFLAEAARADVHLRLALAFAALEAEPLVMDHLDRVDVARAPLDWCYRLGRMLEDKGMVSLARRLYERMVARDRSYRDVAQRYASLQVTAGAETRLDAATVERRFAPRYGNVDLLGHGGMGAVFKAWDRQERRAVAIKVVLPMYAQQPSYIKRFEREASILRTLEHPGIVTVFESGSNPLLHYVMEFVEGQPLDAVLRNHDLGRRPAFVVAVARKLVAALAHAHDAGVLHRDIKPANVVVVNEQGDVKLLDFGVARVGGGTRLTNTGEFVGTFAYIAPEVFVGAESSVRSDLFAVGVLLFECLASVTPWTGAELLPAGRRPAARLDTLLPQMPAALVGLVADCLELDPDRRPADARRLLDRLDALAADVTTAPAR